MYEFSCDRMHRTEIFRHMKDAIPKSIDCGSCPHLAYRVFAPAAVRSDFPEHFNVSMGCVVKNRKHHERLQRERGLQDWSPCNNSPGSQLVKDRL